MSDFNEFRAINYYDILSEDDSNILRNMSE